MGRPEPSGLDRHFGDKVFKPPVGEWAKLPLFAGKRCIGFLVLDNAEYVRSFSPEQRGLISLFGHQAAAALARALEQEERQLLLEIGREITKQAAIRKFDDLLDAVRQQIGKVMAVDNFMVVLLDQDSNHLDYRRQYEDGKLQPRHWRSHLSCLCGEVVRDNKPLLLPQGGQKYRHEHGMQLCGRSSRSWLGVPLRINDKAIGAIAVQDYEIEYKYGTREERLLVAVADQVAGALWMSYEAEREAKTTRYQESHTALRNDLRRLAEGNEYWFWHAVLTAITHRDGLSFNRAALFWFDETGKHMQGRMGIGYFNCQETHDAWEADERTGWSFQEYLRKPDLARQKPTPLQQSIASWNLTAGGSESPCARVREQGRRYILLSTDLSGCLPDELLNPPDLLENAKSYACALVPVKSGDGVLGLLVVDNFVDGKPLRPSDLEKLEDLLKEATQVWLRAIETRQSQQLGESYKDVLDLSRQIMGQAASRPLKESLEELCRQAQRITQAGYVVIYPYRSSGGSYDVGLVSYSNGLNDKAAKARNKPRQQGVTFSILQSGVMVVPDVVKSELSFGGRPLAEHDFVEREQIGAFIGAPMRSATGEPLGVIYLDYRFPQQFTQQDIARAEQIASIGANAISYVRTIERETHGRAEAETREQLRQRAMQFLSNIQAQALSPDSDEEKVIRAILRNTSELFERKVKVTLAMLTWETRNEDKKRVRLDYHTNQTGVLVKNRASSVYHGKLGESIKRTDEQPESAQSHLDGSALLRPIQLGGRLVGSLLVRRRSAKESFDAAELEMVERLAPVAALALDNVRSRTYLQTVADTVSAVSDPRGLEDTLQAVVAHARKVAPDIDCVTLWYLDYDQEGELVPGPQWGIRNAKYRHEDASTGRLVREVMKRENPLFALEAVREDSLRGDFIGEESIKSTAAFPLRFGQQPEAFGAMFLNYRDSHVFTASERTLFPIFANAVATAIHDAQTLQQARQGQERLNAALNVVNAVGTELDLDKVLRQVLTALKRHFDKPDVEVQPYVMRYDEEDESLYLPAVAREFKPVDKPQYQKELRLHLDGRDKGVVCRVGREALKQGKVHVENFDDITKDDDYLNFNDKSVSLLCAGLAAKEKQTGKNRLWGVLAVSSPTEKAFNVQDKLLLQLAAQQALMAMKRAEQAALSGRDAIVAGAIAWAADVAHDIDSEVGLIRSDTYTLLNFLDPPLPDKGRDWVKAIDDRARALANTSSDALAGQKPRDSSPFRLTQILRDRIADWQPSHCKNVSIRVDGDENVEICASQERVWRAVRLLLRNAAEAMNYRGAVSLSVGMSEEPIPKAELRIRDTGPGFERDVRRLIFLGIYTTNSGTGHGNGLLIAQWLIKSMGGTIQLLPSTQERGAEFLIQLPFSSMTLEEKDDV